MSSSPENEFDYSTLDQETATVIQACTKTIQSRPLASVEKMIEVGQQLQIVKEKLKHGQFYSWLQFELGIKPRQARRMMQIARHFKAAESAALKFSPSALSLFAENKIPETARQEAFSRAASGETITHRLAKEIISRHKRHTTYSPTAALRFCVGDRIRILRRQEGKDKWTGCTAIIWEVTPNGWLRVDVEEYKGVKFTLKPEWVELMEKTEMTETQDHNQPESIRLEDKPSNDSDTPETFVISSPSFTAQVKCAPSKMIAILDQLRATL